MLASIMDVQKVELALSPTVESFVHATETITILISPAGEGKTIGCIATLFAHSHRCGRSIRVAIIRDTFENIRISVIPSFQQFFDKVLGTPWQPWLTIKNDGKELLIKGNPYNIQIDCFGIDDPASLGRLQGTTAFDIIWINEPAPISAKKNAGVAEEVYNAAVLRCVRGGGKMGRLMVDMNPADEEHWTCRRFIEEDDINPEFPLVRKRVFQIPYGENKKLEDIERQAAALAYQHDPDAYARYVTGKFATVYLGEKVTGEFFKPERHVSPVILEPIRGWTSFAFCDGWTNPVCLLGQIGPTGRLFFLDTCRLNISDIRTLLDTQVKFMLNSPRWQGKTKAWRVGGDFSMSQPDQSNLTSVSSKAVEDFFKGSRFEKGPVKFEPRKSAVIHSLRDPDEKGNSLVCISPHNKMLIKGLKGAWHYPTNNQGQITSNLPDQNEECHVCEAYANAVSVLLPMDVVSKQDRNKWRLQANKMRKRAAAYGSARAAGGM